MSVARAAVAPSVIPRVPWLRHRAYLDERWCPGEHCAVIGRTGGGKSHLIRRGLLPVWAHARVIVIDPTEDDVNYGHPFKRVTKGMPNRLHRLNTDPHWFRLVPSMDPEQGSDAVRDVLHRAYAECDWVIVNDELRKTTDARFPCYGLLGHHEELVLRARKRRVTVIMATQAPRWIPSSTYEQPTYLYLQGLRDRRSRARLQEISGADTDDIIGGLNQLERHEFLFIGPDDHLAIVTAPA